MSLPRTYLDHNATSPLRPEARAAMLSALDLVGNASSVHSEGRRARAVVDIAREKVAALVGAKPEQVVFTSGATEANNSVMRGGWDRVVVSGVEHESVLEPARAAIQNIIELPCGADGRILAGAFGEMLAAAATSPGRTLLSVQFANSETGVLQPVAEAAGAARSAGARVHCDAVQAAGRVPLDFAALGLDLMSISAHKLGGPKGVGALVIRDGFDLPAFMSGGGQERRRRSGTENVAAIAGFGAAAEAALAGLADTARLAHLRDRVEAGVAALTPGATIISSTAPRLPNTSCIALAGEKAATLLIKLDLAGLAISAGSACSSGKIGGSHVLAAMGVARSLADAAIRVSLGWSSTEADVTAFIDAWARIHAAGAARNGIEDRPAFRLTPGPQVREMRVGE